MTYLWEILMTNDSNTFHPTGNLEYDGIAAEDLADGSNELKIIVSDITPHVLSGTLGAGITTNSTSIQDRDGSVLNTSVTTANHIVATWEGAPNRRYPGIVRKGEEVHVFRKSGQDRWQWREKGGGRDFRTTDRIVHEVSATDPTKPGVPNDDTNSYTIGMDSDKGIIFLKTSKANKEPVAWSIEVNTKTGVLHITDDAQSPGNRIVLDTGATSHAPVFQVNLSTGAALQIEGENAYLKVPKNIQIVSGERIVLDSPLLIFNKSAKGTVIINAATVAVTATAGFLVKSALVGLDAASTKLTGIIIAAGGRIANLVRGPVGGGYSMPTVSDPNSGPARGGSNSADTGMSGTPYQ